MASYQIPQFLDSGEKIFLNMNIRQFAYALGGFFIVVIVYALTQALYPPIGVYAIIPAIPFGIFFAYLALGRFNGRDSEIYVLKIIIYLTKPRNMRYQKQPDYTDANSRMQDWTFDKISARWNSDVSKQKEIDSNEYNTFEQADYNTKIKQIKSLAKQVNEPTTSIMMTVKEREKELANKEKTIRDAESVRRAKKK